MALVKPQVAETGTVEVIQAEVTEMVEEKSTVSEVVNSTEVAVAASGQLSGMKALLEEQADLGFEDIEISQFSFDRIRLHEGKFQKGEEELGEKFLFVPLSSRAIYIIKQNNDEDGEMFYSYCPEGTTTADGGSSKAIRDAWKEEGFDTPDNPVIISKYMEIMAQVIGEDGEAGDVVSLSIPPSSRARFGQVPAMAKMRFQANTNEVVVEAQVGAKVGEGKKAFRPWNFKVVRKA